MGTVDKPMLMITGATGFLGRNIIEAAVGAGHPVRAVARTAEAIEIAPWQQRAGIDAVAIDLAGPKAQESLRTALEGVDCVVHAAVASGDDDAHARGTITPTATLIAAMSEQVKPPRLVLISSLSVYNYASMPAGCQVDETTPLEPEPGMRDAYCRAKLAQEAMARRAAQRAGLQVVVLRPGAIVGHGRLHTPRLGFGVGPFLLMPGGKAPLPLIAVEDCAALVLRATQTGARPSDVPIPSGHGSFEAVNLVGHDQPSQIEYARLLTRHGWPRATLHIPLRLARIPAQALWVVGLLLPDLVLRLPGALRLESFDARFKALRYSTARAEDRLAFTTSRAAHDIVQGSSST